MFQKLEEVEAHFEDIEVRLTSPEVASQAQLFQKLSKEHSALQPVIRAYREYKQVKSHFDQNVEMIASDDGELADLARDENKELEVRLEELVQELKISLLPKDPNDERNSLLEIRAGAGGDEAGIFAGELFRMYSRYAERQGWKIEILSTSDSEAGGMKEVIALVQGDRVFSRLKYESGVHRVQRVPKTETQGRVHTSTVTVAVLPEADEVEVTIDPNHLRIDVFRSSGPGGQSVNTTDSAVRITHLPTNTVVICRDEKSQIKNKAKAMKVLQSRLLAAKQQEQHDRIAADRQSQVGTGDRSEKIRTYNFPQGRVTDHRIGVTVHQVDAFMQGEIGDLISQLVAYYQAELLKSQAGGGIGR